MIASASAYFSGSQELNGETATALLFKFIIYRVLPFDNPLNVVARDQLLLTRW